LFNGQVPEFDPNNHTIRVRHREFLGDIIGSTGFSSYEYVINPGEVGTFPWLSKMSGLYTQYTLKGLIFEFVSTSATSLNSTNTALGTVIMATRYNEYDPSFTSKIEMENHEFSSSAKPSCDQIHPVECDPSETPFKVHFVRQSGLSTSQDARLYDWGVFTLATVGMQAAATIGELWVSYDVVFEKPRLNPNAYPNPLHWRISNGPCTSTYPLGVLQRGYGGNLACTVTGSYDQVTFPDYVQSGRFLVMVLWTGASQPSGTAVTYVSNCAQATSGYGWALDGVYQTVSASYSVNQRLVDVSGPGPVIGIDFSSGAPDTVDVWITQMPSGSEWPINLDTSMVSLMDAGYSSRFSSTPDDYKDELDESEYAAVLEAMRQGKLRLA
jgi:hypothetical protein